MLDWPAVTSATANLLVLGRRHKADIVIVRVNHLLFCFLASELSVMIVSRRRRRGRACKHVVVLVAGKVVVVMMMEMMIMENVWKLFNHWTW